MSEARQREARPLQTLMTTSLFRLVDFGTTEPPAGLTHALAGLWWDAKGDWKRAHESAQRDEGTQGSWVHAYLHRKEGDQGNAAYWYNRAGKPVCRETHDAGWLRIARALLAWKISAMSYTLSSVATITEEQVWKSQGCDL